MVSPGILSYPVTETGGDGQPVVVWHRENLAVINLIASNLPKLGNDHPISRGVCGWVCFFLSWVRVFLSFLLSLVSV